MGRGVRGEKCRIQKDKMRGETRAVQNILYVEVSVSKWIQGRRSFRPSGQKATGSLPNGIDLIYFYSERTKSAVEREGETKTQRQSFVSEKRKVLHG